MLYKSTSDKQNTSFNKNVHLFPNPNNGSFQIYLNDIDIKGTVSIYTFSGECIYEESFEGNIFFVNLDYKSKGMYVLSIKNNDMKVLFNEKFIIE